MPGPLHVVSHRVCTSSSECCAALAPLLLLLCSAQPVTCGGAVESLTLESRSAALKLSLLNDNKSSHLTHISPLVRHWAGEGCCCLLPPATFSTQFSTQHTAHTAYRTTCDRLIPAAATAAAAAATCQLPAAPLTSCRVVSPLPLINQPPAAVCSVIRRACHCSASFTAPLTSMLVVARAMLYHHSPLS